MNTTQTKLPLGATNNANTEKKPVSDTTKRLQSLVRTQFLVTKQHDPQAPKKTFKQE